MTSAAESGNSYEVSGKRNRRFRALPSNPWVKYVGDCSAMQKYLDSKEGCLWAAPKFLDALLRGVAQVNFANNPLSGLIILLALTWGSPIVGLASLVCSVVALLTAHLIGQPRGNIAAGLTTYNALLVGSVTVSIYGEHVDLKVWGFVILGAALSVFITAGLANIFSSYKPGLPCLTLPFNVVGLVIFAALMPPFYHPSDKPMDANGTEIPVTTTTIAPIAADVENSTTVDDSLLNWGSVLNGIIVSAGQVYAVEDVISSLLIYTALLIYSPILCAVSFTGAIVGTISGIFFTPAPYAAVYAGLWGYNGILSAAAIGGFFIAMTCHSFWTAMANVLFTVLVQQTLLLAFAQIHMPVFTLPFVLSTFVFLSVTGNHLPRVTNITFPEIHRYEYMQTLKKAPVEKEGEMLKDIKILEEEKEPVKEKEEKKEEIKADLN